MGKFNIKKSSIGQVTDSGVNLISHKPAKSLWDKFLSWNGVIGTAATLISGIFGWYALHVQLGWWFPYQ